ncbi:uncharacterized protein LOC143290513 isoform X2 [Babylonia areolata]|uniref:uncharacterized protein LOC143290513 isoform X2 n=1 Tax=Babylonia areolata TaxID=304850 RepID=UPI003FD52BE4
MATEKFVVIFGLLLFVLLCHYAEACGWNTTALQGTVQSPNFPGNYSNNQDCVYIITAPAGYQVTLTFTDFDLEPHGSCSFDYVEIRDGDGVTSPRIGRHCNTSLPGPERTFGNQMWIRFFSDTSRSGRGFRATFASANLQAPFFLIASSIGSNVGGSIHRMDVETKTNYIIPMTQALYYPIAVDYDPVEQTIYWTEVGLITGIRGAALNGSGVHTVISTSSDSIVGGLAVDPLSRLIFYTDAGRDIIAMLTMSAFAHKTIINTSLDQPRAIVLNTADGVMFWTDWGAAPKIERASYDGSDRRTLVNTGLHFPNALALDVPNNRLYWVDAAMDQVEMSDLEGGNRRQVLQLGSSHHFYGLALLHGFLYITDWKSVPPSVKSFLVRLDINTANVTVYGTTSGDTRLNDIHVVNPRQYSDDSVNGCGKNNGGCEAFCVPLPSNSSKCTCPDGQTLTSDQHSCVDESSASSTAVSTSTTTTAASTSTAASASTTATAASTSTAASASTMSTAASASTAWSTTSTTTTPTTTTSTSPSVAASAPAAFSVVVTTADTQPFKTNGDGEMTLTCDPNMAVDVTSYAWNVPCTRQTGNTCVFTPRPAEDDGKTVTCTVTTSDGWIRSGELQIELNYPPQEAPTINGHSEDTVYQQGDSLTMTCSVHGGKPLVTSVYFTCGTHEDTTPDIFSTTEVHSLLSIAALTVEDDGKTCFCTAKWEDTDWYKLSATAVLRVQRTKPSKQELNIPVVVGGSVGAVIVIVIIVVVVCIVVKRRGQLYNKPSRTLGQLDDDGYSDLVYQRQQPPVCQSQPYIINRVYDEAEDDKRNSSSYQSLEDMAATGNETNDYLSPVPEPPPAKLKPVPCSWNKAPGADDGYLGAVRNPAHNDYSFF